MKNKFKKLLKNKRFILFMILFIVLIICLILLKSAFFPSGGSNYGNRLDGIDKISFKDSDKSKIVKSIKTNEKVTEAKIIIHGKIINVIYNVAKDTTIEDARKIAEGSLEKFSDKVKGFYDIQFMITNKDEEGEEIEITNDDGSKSKEISKKFPIMGYKNSKSTNIVW